MTRRWTAAALAGVLLLGGAITAWTIRESSLQRLQMEEALRSEAALLARTLAPALAAASSAARELDEIVAWKLLDNARLMARLDAAGALDHEAMEDLLEADGLDLILIVDGNGRTVRRAGVAGQPESLVDQRVMAVATGAAGEVILGWSSDAEGDHVGAAAARPGGGAVVVRTDAGTAYAFARRLGVDRLLEDTTGVGGVLYLELTEEPGGSHAFAWDGGEVPGAGSEPGAVRTVRGRGAFEVSMPVPVPAGRKAALRVGLDAEPLVQAAAAANRRAILVGAALAAFGLAAAGVALVSRARTAERAEAARRLAEAEESRRRSERLSAAGALAAGLAHEVRNPLNAIAMAAQRIQRAHEPEAACSGLAGTIRREAGRLDGILKGFMDLARPAPGPRKAENLGALLGEVVALMEMEATDAGLHLQSPPARVELRAVVDREAIRGALINLVRNAIQASPAGGSLAVAMERRNGRARVVITDEGPGIDPAIADRVFDPFVTTRAQGSGMGLALVRRVAEEHGGTALLRNRGAGGAEAVLELELEEPER